MLSFIVNPCPYGMQTYLAIVGFGGATIPNSLNFYMQQKHSRLVSSDALLDPGISR